MWRPSYRLVIDDPKGGAAAAKTADMQVWGIVQNQSGENWKGVTLSLVAGAPIAFQATLDKPVIPLRPIVSDRGEVFSSVPTGETSLAEAPPPPPAGAGGWASTPGYAPAADEAEEQDGDYTALADQKAPARSRAPLANKDLARGPYRGAPAPAKPT